MNLSIIVPAKDEEKRIPNTLERLGSAVLAEQKKDPALAVEVLIIINNTTDNTAGVIEKHQKKYPFLSYVTVPIYTGKGGALEIGFKMASGEYVAFIDADGSSSPKDIFRMYDQMKANPNIDGLAASRYINGAEIVGGQPLSRTIYSRLFNFITRFGFGLNYKDTQCGLKMFKKEVAKSFVSKISSVGWTFDLNILLIAKLLNFTIKEIPSRWVYKDDSNINPAKAMRSVPKELITLKIMAWKTAWNNFYERTFLTREIDRSRAAIIVTTQKGIASSAKLERLLDKAGKDSDITVFTEKIPNTTPNQMKNGVEYIRRGSGKMFGATFLLYYTLFFRRTFSTIVIERRLAERSRFLKLLINIISTPRTVVLLDQEKFLLNGFNYSISKFNLERIAQSLGDRSLLSKKYYPWSNSRYKTNTL